MNKIYQHGALVAFLFLTAFTTTVQAELIPRLNGQVLYDTVLDVTWLADGRLAKTEPFGLTLTTKYTTAPPLLTAPLLEPGEIDDFYGFMIPETAVQWLQGMNDANYLGFSDWRLPTTLTPDASCMDINIANGIGTDNIEASGTDCAGSELGHLHSVDFGILQSNSWTGSNPDAIARVSNLGGIHLSSTEFATADPYVFSFLLGTVQAPFSVITAAYEIQDVVTVWPVRDGDISEYPVSNPGMNATVHIGAPFMLDGSASSDPDGNYPLTYSWSLISAPQDSTATLSDATVVAPTFEADEIGDYVFELVVTDSLGFDSAPMQVNYSTYNTAPVADAGLDQMTVVNGSTIQLDGSQSYDDDGDTFTAEWGFTDKPSGSAATLSDPSSLTPTFDIDVYGTYKLSLTVTDVFGERSAADEVTISVANVKPVANPGMDQTGTVGDIFMLDGSGSSDANNDALTFSWSFTTIPDGSNAVLADTTSVQTSFTADIAGRYIIELVVNDGLLNSPAETVEVEVTDVQLNVIDILTQAVDTLNAIPKNRQNFTHRRAKRMMSRMLNRAIARINHNQHGHHNHEHHDPEAILSRVLRRTDGCASDGSRDRNDWIKQCDDQTALYNLITDAINQL